MISNGGGKVGILGWEGHGTWRKQKSRLLKIAFPVSNAAQLTNIEVVPFWVTHRTVRPLMKN